jgi:hypothetical protein
MTKFIKFNKFNWRDHLSVHPAAELFPVMAQAELNDLAKDIARYGLQTPIIIWSAADDDKPHEALLDGRNRLDAAARAGLLSIDNGELCIRHPSGDYVPIPKSYCRDDDPYAVVLSYNIQRRHLTPQQRRELITKILQRNPGASNRRIAAQVKAHHATVADVRAKAEAGGLVYPPELVTGHDGKSYPAKHEDKPRALPSYVPSLIDAAMELIAQMTSYTLVEFDRRYRKKYSNIQTGEESQ